MLRSTLHKRLIMLCIASAYMTTRTDGILIAVADKFDGLFVNCSAKLIINNSIVCFFRIWWFLYIIAFESYKKIVINLNFFLVFCFYNQELSAWACSRQTGMCRTRAGRVMAERNRNSQLERIIPAQKPGSTRTNSFPMEVRAEGGQCNSSTPRVWQIKCIIQVNVFDGMKEGMIEQINKLTIEWMQCRWWWWWWWWWW